MVLNCKYFALSLYLPLNNGMCAQLNTTTSMLNTLTVMFILDLLWLFYFLLAYLFEKL